MLFAVSIVPMLVYLFYKTAKSLHILQLNWYNENNRYLKWVFRNYKKVFIDYSLIFLLIPICSYLKDTYVYILIFSFYLIIATLYKKHIRKDQVKLPLVFTKRIKRMIIITYVLHFIFILLYVFNVISLKLWIFYFMLGLLLYFNSIVISIVNILDKPFIWIEKKYFTIKAKRKLKSMSNLNVIGITGSYGKTSSKNILNGILDVKYNSCPTPKNYNTFNGMLISINNYLDKFSDVFIAEMGAFKKGSIKSLSKLVKPKYGILTKIGVAHLESFGSQENIQKAKFELIESLPIDGVAILNRDDKLQVNYKLKNNCRVIWIGVDNEDADVIATDIQVSYQGMKFKVKFKNESEVYDFETKLLGRANVYNILASLALAEELGMDKKDMIWAVGKLESIKHRLELKKYRDIFIIDDAYNSNPEGSKMALEVLSEMPGKRIIVTPGMIDLGPLQEKLNYEFGTYIPDYVDEVILVGETQTRPIYEGIKSKNFPDAKIHIINDVKIAFTLIEQLKENSTYVLLENDLPDIFNED